MDSPIQTRTDLFKLFLAPYILLLILYLLVIGGGGSWLYLSAQRAQTELVTTHMLNVIRPAIRQLELEQGNAYELSKLSQKIVNLYHTLPQLRQISIRDRNKGYGVRLAANGKLVNVELEPLSIEQIIEPDHKALAHQLLHKDGLFFHVYFYLTGEKNQIVQVDLAFDRAGLVDQIEQSMRTLIHSIVIFCVLGIVSLVIALGLSFYIGSASRRMGERLQIFYQQAAIGKLAADLVHDLRNPLASIRANIKNLLITPKEKEEVVDEMDQDLMRLEHKLTDFLKLTKPREGVFATVDLHELLQGIVRQCSALFKEKRQTLIVDVAPDITTLPVMADLLTDALLNLLVNAKDHSPEQGYINLRARSSGMQVEIIVEDDGPGISVDVLPRIFEPFFTTRPDGHGLGLAIAKRIIKAHNGTLTAQNRIEGGARFIITLPIKQHYE